MEVPARFVRDTIRAAIELGADYESLLEGTSFDPADLDSALRRFSWNDCALVCDHAAAAMGTVARVEELGARSVHMSASWAVLRFVPHAVSPTRGLRLGFAFAGPALFPHIHHAHEVLPDGRVRLVLRVPPPYRPCEAFFRMCVGGVRSIPAVFGYPPAVLDVKAISPEGLTLEVTPPPSRTIAARISNAVGALLGAGALYDEVGRQHEALHALFGDLLRNQRELREFMESIPDTIAVHRDGVLVWGNRALLAALKCASLDELKGRRLLDFVHPLEHEPAARRLSSTIGEALPGTYRVRAFDGTYRTFEVSRPQEVTFEGSPARMTIARDVTERDAMRAQLVLADRMTQLGFLAAGVAHEINNPLAYALAALDAAELDLTRGRPDAAARALATVREGAERVRAITRDLRLFSRGGEERVEAVDVTGVLRATVDLALANVRTHGRIETELGPVPPVMGDEARIGQVFMNLLVNALDARHTDGEERSVIRVRALTNAAGEAVVEVEDDGRGIQRDVLPRIFDPFFTTKAPRAGSGLGLAICHRIVSDLGGRIEAFSPPREGATGALFRVAFPACAPPTLPSVAPPLPSSEEKARRLHVLVVDDEPALARALGHMLSDDHDVEIVTSGDEAMKRLGAGTGYDVILCDLMMAGLGGVDVYERLRRDRPEMASRIVFMTGGAFGARAQKFLAEVKNPCLDKPFTLEGVRAALEAAIAHDHEAKGPA